MENTDTLTANETGLEAENKMAQRATLPKGTIVKLNGLPYELLGDVRVSGRQREILSVS